ncbi:MAG: amidohydrolase [Planctomycetota bacterium]|nr:MAG: amidohydrolase [Planctomycetota bacterium]
MGWLGACGGVLPAQAQIAVRGNLVYTSAGKIIRGGVVVIENGKITKVRRFKDTVLPADYTVYEAEVVTPGLIDAHTVAGLSGLYNQKQDQDQLERSKPIQPELRAVDAYNPRDPLITWLRGFGITTIHTGHAPGEVISGQTMVVKTYGETVEDALLRAPVAVAATLSPAAIKKDKGKSPGTRGKMMALLRQELIKAREYLQKKGRSDPDKQPARDLKLEVLGKVLQRHLPLMVTAQRAQDIENVLRLKEEFKINVWLDGGAESYLLADRLKKAGIPVILHPLMARRAGDLKNAAFDTPLKLRKAGVYVVLQSGYESYVPKTRVVLFEAAQAVAHGMDVQDALALITIDAARLLGVADRVGSIEIGKDADLALFDGNPFEYTTHCIGTMINGKMVHYKPQ